MATSPLHHTAKDVPRQTGRSNRANGLAEAMAFLLSGLLCCAALIWVYQLWRADLRVPIQYAPGGDLTFEDMLVKDIVETGWFLHNPRIGAPGEQDLRDFPMPDLVTSLSTKVLSWFTSSWGAIVNLYFFLGFLLATWSAQAVLRHFGIARAPAVVAALLFAFAPYHFFRAEWHLHLSAYFVVPLAGMLMLWVMSGERLFTLVRRSRFFVFPMPSRKGAVALVACLMLGSDGAYYAFFTILLLAGAGMFRVFGERSLRRAGVAAMLAAAIVLAVVVNLLPNIVHIMVDGKNPEVAVRGSASAELYALKLTQMVLPIPGHRIPKLAALRSVYDSTQAGVINEAQAVTLGIFAAAGFCFLLLSLVAGYPWEEHRELIRHLSLLNLCAFLIGTLGGIGSLLAWTVWTQIRAYNRISIFISFFSIVAVAALLDQSWRRWARTAVYRGVWGALLASILIACLLDQTSPGWVPPHELDRALYRSDAEFGEHAERWLPHGSMVLQLPFLPFPEAETPGSMVAYDPLIPYLHSTSLRWSYGAMKGRYWSNWQASLSPLPIEEVLDTAAVAGFSAIYIDRDGYADHATDVGARLLALGLPRIEGHNGRFWLYDIQPYASRLQAEFTPETWTRLRDAVLHPLVLEWLPDCSTLEGDARQNWHWCGSRGGFLLENHSAQTKRVDIHGAVLAGAGAACSLRVDGPGWEETLPLKAAPQPLGHSLTIPPGTSMVHMQSDCQRLVVPTDVRPLVFRIDNFNAVLEGATPAPELDWSGGFYPLEKDGSRTWHWCSSSGELIVRNPGPASQATIHMIVVSSQTQPAPLSIAGPGFTESVTMGPARTEFSKRFVVPQGSSLIRFSSSSAPLIPPNDPRKLVFRVEDLWLGNPLPAPTIMFH